MKHKDVEEKLRPFSRWLIIIIIIIFAVSGG
jgi:hypothetical protein